MEVNAITQSILQALLSVLFCAYYLLRELARAGVDPLTEDVRWDARCMEVKTFKWIISKKNVYVPEQPSMHDSLYGRCLMHQHNCHITDDVPRPCDLRDGFPALVFALNWLVNRWW